MNALFRNEQECCRLVDGKRVWSRGRIKIRPSCKRIKQDKLLDLIRDRVKDLSTKYFNNNTKSNNNVHNYGYIEAEALASEFQVASHRIKQCFQVLKLEGLLGYKENRAPHDSTRDFFWRGGESAWCPTRYWFK